MGLRTEIKAKEGQAWGRGEGSRYNLSREPMETKLTFLLHLTVPLLQAQCHPLRYCPIVMEGLCLIQP